MPKLLSFPRPGRWTPSFLSGAFPEEVWISLALDPPVSFLRQVHALQRRLAPLYQGVAWVDPRDWVLPVVEVPEARTAALAAVVSRLRGAAGRIPPGRLRAEGVEAGPGGVWLKLQDFDGAWEDLLIDLSRGLERDGFTLGARATTRLLLGEASTTESVVGPPVPGERLGGEFRAWDLVLYRRHPAGQAPRYEALDYAPLGEAR